MMKALVSRNGTLLLLVGLCLLCIGAGIQSAEAMRLWLIRDLVPSPPLNPWAETLKAAAMLLFAFAIFCRLAVLLYRGTDLAPSPPGSREQR